MPKSWIKTYGQIIISYDRDTQITHVVVLSQNDIFGSIMLKSITDGKKDWSGPVSMTAELLSIVLEHFEARIKAETGNLGEININTGHFDYSDPDGDSQVADLNFMAMSKTLNMTGQNAAILVASFSSMLQVLIQLRIFAELINGTKEGGTRKGRNAAMENKLHMLTEICNCYLLEAQSIEKRCNVLLQVVSSNRLSICHEIHLTN